MGQYKTKISPEHVTAALDKAYGKGLLSQDQYEKFTAEMGQPLWNPAGVHNNAIEHITAHAVAAAQGEARGVEVPAAVQAAQRRSGNYSGNGHTAIRDAPMFDRARADVKEHVATLAGVAESRGDPALADTIRKIGAAPSGKEDLKTSFLATLPPGPQRVNAERMLDDHTLMRGK